MNLPTYAELEQFYRHASAEGYRLRLTPKHPYGYCWAWRTPDGVTINGYTDAECKRAALVFAAMDPQLSAH